MRVKHIGIPVGMVFVKFYCSNCGTKLTKEKNHRIPLLALLNQCVEGDFMNSASMQLFKVFSSAEEMFSYLENYVHVDTDLTVFKDVNRNIK